MSMEPWLEELYYPPADDTTVLRQCLNAVGFVGRIVFGRRNYAGATDGKKAKHRAAYYHKCAEVVREFCTAHDIECIIKRGTGD